MKTLKSIRNKIEVTDEIHSVVKTMKTMAASRISQLEAAAESLTSYYKTVELGILAWVGVEKTIPEQKEEKSEGLRDVLAVVCGSDLGLVGQFNEKLALFTAQELNKETCNRELWIYGRLMEDKLFQLGYGPSRRNRMPGTMESVTLIVDKLLKDINEGYGLNKQREVYLFYNRICPEEGYEPKAVRILPLDIKWIQKIKDKWPTSKVPDVIGSRESTIEELIREYLFVNLYEAFTQSLLSENTSRLKAMKHAEKTIDDIKDDLNKSYHQLRQEKIDEELFDVISGFQLLGKKKEKRG